VLSWVVAGAGLLCALAALAWARRLSRGLEALKQSYWDLRYEYTRMRSQLARLDPEQPPVPDAEAAAPPAPPTVTFVPLSTMRKKDR
jgi:hypothetical protein